MRVVSFLPSATEIVFALGASDKLVGVTDKCDYPLEAKEKPVVVTSALDTTSLSSAEIDETVSRYLAEGKSLYRVDTEKLKALQPDLIFAQGVCDICAASNPEVAFALEVVPHAQVVWLNPSTLDDILDDIVRIAEALGVRERGERLRAQLQERIEAVRETMATVAYRPRVWVAEWVVPPYCCGHWVPQMVEIAGGVEGLGRAGQPSRRLRWEEVLAWQPEVIVLAPCGFRIEQTLQDAEVLMKLPHWQDLPAVRSGRVFVADGDYFTCPGPRLVTGVEILAHLLHPHLFPSPSLPRAFKRLII
ncbi:MAG: cobalamin-binding protein [Candidatus Fervidibacterota bacterium]